MPHPLLLRLRHETAPYHEAVEQNEFNQALAAGRSSVAATARFLAKMHGFLQPYEAQLQQQNFGPEWEIDQRLRSHLILEDLQVSAAALPLCTNPPPLATVAQLLGAMYVMEGSTLGGQVLARQLAAADVPLRTYFAGNAERTGLLWQSFCRLLPAAVADDAAAEAAVVASAGFTFQHLAAWLNQP